MPDATPVGKKSTRRILQCLALISFFPYPSVLQVGQSTGLQIGQLLCALIFFALLPRCVVSTSWIAFLFLALPTVISYGVLTIVAGMPDQSLADKAFVSTLFTLLALPAFGALLKGMNPEILVSPVASAILIHFALIVVQVIAFTSGSFPLESLYDNPSFAQIPSDYSLYVRRPLGLFPEPSAMAAAVGPWSVWLLHFGITSPRSARRLLAVLGGSAGVLAVFMSGSVYAPFLGIALALLVLKSPMELFLKATLSGFVVAAAVVLLPSAEWFVRAFESNESLVYRLNSLKASLSLPLADATSVFIGSGPGQTGTLFREGGSEFPAVYSLVGEQYVTKGLLGLLGVAAIGVIVARRVRSTPPWVAVGLLLLLSFVGATSYWTLLPMWLMLSVLLDARLTPGQSLPLGDSSTRGARVGVSDP